MSDLEKAQDLNNSIFKDNLKENIDSNQGFSLFKRIGMWFDQYEKREIKKSEHKRNYEYLSEQVNDFLRQDMLEFVFELTQKGYPLNEQQQAIFHRKMTKISLHSPNDFFESLLKKGYTIEDQYLVNSFFSYQGVYNWSCIHSEKFREEHKNKAVNENLLHLLVEKIQDPTFSRLAFDTWQVMIKNMVHEKVVYNDNFSGTDYVQSYINVPVNSYINENGNFLFLQCSFDEYVKSLSLLQQIPTVKTAQQRVGNFKAYESDIEFVIKSLKNNMNTNIQQQINDWKEETSELFSNEVLIKNTIQNTIQIAKHIDLRDIPQEVQIMIKHIKELHAMIDMDKLDRDQQTDIKKLSEKKIPDILQKYLSIHPDYRTTLTNSSGKNAQELMITSLKDIEEIMTSAITYQEENKLKDLSVQHRLTKEIKQRF